jgi:RNA polymerase sigma-70 factor (ECF subfamily)
LLAAINSLPDGFRIVFNMRVVEGYKHREISEILGIEIGTSKSQFFRARTMLQEKLAELKKERIS